MKVLSVDLEKSKDGLVLDLQSFSPTLGWSNVGLSKIENIVPPADGVQEYILFGTPPSGPALQSIQVYPFRDEFKPPEWFKGVRILSSRKEVLTTLRSVVVKEEPIGDDWVSLNSVTIEDDKVIIDVSYSGGCKEHDFQLSWDGAVIKTNPPQIVLELSHNGNDDICEAFLTEELRFDLSPAVDNHAEYRIRIRSGDHFANRNDRSSTI